LEKTIPSLQTILCGLYQKPAIVIPIRLRRRGIWGREEMYSGLPQMCCPIAIKKTVIAPCEPQIAILVLGFVTTRLGWD